jgi:flagellin
MSSILTNTSAMSALAALTATQNALNGTQNQISTGLRVATASDNAAYWAISTTMKSDTGVLSAVTDALNLGSSTVGVATAAINSTLTIMNKLKQDVATAQTPGVNLDSIETDIAALQDSLRSISSSASFNGVNMLSYDSSATGAGSVSIVSSYGRADDGTGALGYLSVDTTQTILFDSVSGGTNTGILSANGTNYSSASLAGFSISSTTSLTDLKLISKDIDAAIAKITTAGEVLGATKTNIDNQSTFVSALSDAITSGVGSLVDADMNVASTRLQALQTQQQLGVQSLSIANQNSQLILKLFSS